MSNPVFISYSRRANATEASALAARLGDLAFFDTTEIADGDEFPQRLFDALLDAQLTVIFASAEYAKSRWCQLEMRLAVFGSDESASQIVMALGRESGTVRDAMPPVVAECNWPPAAEAERLAKLVAERLEKGGKPLRSRLGEDAAMRLQLAFREETSLPQPRAIAVPCSLPDTVSLRSIGTRFVGMAAKLREIHRVLFEGEGATAPVAAKIVGGPGSGKTRLATEYLNRYGNYYSGGVFWIGAAAPSLDEELWRVLSDLDPTVPDLGQLREQKVDLKRKLGRALRAIGKPVLYLIDDVPEAGPGEAARSLAEFCPAIGAVTVLATSRQDSHEAGVQAIEVESMGGNSAVLLLTDRLTGATRLSWEKWQSLSSWVGDLPLALDIMNAGLALGEVTTQELLAAVENAGSPAAELDEMEESLRPQVPAGALVGITKTFRISFDKLQQSAQDLAFVLAQLAPAPIPMAFILSLPELLRPGAARAALRSRHFVTGGSDTLFGIMHRLMSDFLRSLRREDAAALLQGVGRQLGGEMHLERIGDPAQWPGMNLYRVHATFLFDRIVALPSFDPQLLHLGALAARIAVEQGDFAAAKPTQQRVLDVSKQLLGEEHPDTLLAMGNLASTLAALGEFTPARQLQERVLELSRKVKGEEHPETLAAMSNLAETLRQQGDFAKARELQEQALAANLKIGPDTEETLSARNNLALTLESQGDLPRALSLQEEAAAASEQLLGSESPRRLKLENNLAVSRRRMGDLAGARKLGDYIVPIAQRVLGDEHPETLRAMHSLAATMAAQGELAKARALEESVLTARKRILGEEHPETLDAMNNLASILGQQGDLAGERALEERTFEIRTRILGAEHPDTLTAMNNLATTLRALGDIPRATKLLSQALEINRRLLGDEHPSTLTATDNYAQALVDGGDLAGARQLQERVVEVSVRVLGRDHPDTLQSMSNLADTLLLQHDFAGARALQEFVLETRKRTLGEEHPDTLTSMANLGVTLVQTGHLQDGLDLIRKTYEGRRKVLGEQHPDTVMAAGVVQSLTARLAASRSSGG
jgi:tetratricopeptide (TPR) repeat protein